MRENIINQPNAVFAASILLNFQDHIILVLESLSELGNS